MPALGGRAYLLQHSNRQKRAFSFRPTQAIGGNSASLAGGAETDRLLSTHFGQSPTKLMVSKGRLAFGGVWGKAPIFLSYLLGQSLRPCPSTTQAAFAIPRSTYCRMPPCW
jgi:hypothetical protein